MTSHMRRDEAYHNVCLTYINGGVFFFFLHSYFVRLSSKFAAENSLAEIQKGKVLS